MIDTERLEGFPMPQISQNLRFARQNCRGTGILESQLQPNMLRTVSCRTAIESKSALINPGHRLRVWVRSKTQCN